MVAEPLPSVLLPLYPSQAEPLVALINVLIAGYIDPETNRKQMRQALEEHEKQYEAQLKLDLGRGLGPFENAPPEVRRQMFMRVTQWEDVPFLLMEPDELIEMVRIQQVQFRSPWWVEVFGLRDMLKKHLLRLFRRDFLHVWAALQAQLGLEPV